MRIEKKQIREIANHALIELSEKETEAQRLDLEKIAAYTEILKELNTTGLPCQTHPFGENNTEINRFRPDTVTNKDRTEEWITAAPDSKGAYFRVPCTIDE